MKKDRCKDVTDQSGWHIQCRLKAKKDGYCHIHHPDAVKARRDAASKKWEDEIAAKAKAREDLITAGKQQMYLNMRKFCKYHGNGSCGFGGDCSDEHTHCPKLKEDQK